VQKGDEERTEWQGGSPWKLEVRTDTVHQVLGRRNAEEETQWENELNPTLRAITSKYIQEPQVSCASRSACYSPLSEQ
jgi:hypothetical protein